METRVENREPEPELRARARRFLHWCFEREEDSIIVVTHSAFMSNLMIEYCMGGHEPCEVMREHLRVARTEVSTVGGGGFAQDVDAAPVLPRGGRSRG